MSRSISSQAALALLALLAAGCETGRCVRHSDCAAPLSCLATRCVIPPSDAGSIDAAASADAGARDAGDDRPADTGATTDAAGPATMDATPDAATDAATDVESDAAADAPDAE